MKTTKYVKELKENLGKNIGNEFTEQDVWEQTRKVMNNA